MKKEWYTLANQLNLSGETVKKEELDEMTKKQYERNILAAIRKEEQGTKQNTDRKYRRIAAAAACLILLGSATAIFHEEVHAAISHISYSLSTALGLESDMMQYTEVVNTSVSDKGYVVTLQEAAVAQDKLVISYTIQQENGQPLSDFFFLNGDLYVNGEKIDGSSSSSSKFLDDENKSIGGEASYDVYDIDLSAENTYEFQFTAFNYDTTEDTIGGHWDFKFKADGSELLADTKFMALGNEFVMPNGGLVTLDTFSDSPLEQRITYHTFNVNITGKYDVKLTATDEQGRTAVFYPSRGIDDKGYMLNAEIIENGRIPADAKTVTVTLYARELPERGFVTDDFIQIGEFTWDMTNLK